MYHGFLCGPGPFAPVDDQISYLRTLRALRDFGDPMIWREIKETKRAIRWRERYDKKGQAKSPVPKPDARHL